MSASIRGHSGQIKFFRDGGDLSIVNLTSVDIKQDSSFMRSFYVGQNTPEGDQSMDGWSGSCEMQVKDAALDEMIDALVSDNLAGIGVGDYTFLTTENYADGSSKSYVYFDVQFKMGRKQSGLNDKITKSLDFQASGRKPL